MSEELGELISTIARDVMQSFVDPAEVTPSLLPRDPAEETMACEVPVVGAFQGRIMVRASRSLVDCVAGHMFGGVQVDDAADVLAHEALRELANIVAGNLKPLLGPSNSLGIPIDVPATAALPYAGSVATTRLRLVTGQIDIGVYKDAEA